jgi:hypothetical protein
VAITGSLPAKADNRAVPITVGEQVEGTQAPFDLSHVLKAAEMFGNDEIRDTPQM